MPWPQKHIPFPHRGLLTWRNQLLYQWVGHNQLSNLIWPGHPSMAGNSLFTMDLKPTTIRTDSQERCRLLHPYELEGVLNPTANKPNNLQQLARNEELIETIQTMEHRSSPYGSKKRFQTLSPIIQKSLLLLTRTSSWG